jgi:phenylalanyl-tRNA synthetase alpha chain
MQPNLIDLKNQALALVNEAKDKSELDRLKLEYLGRKGQINQILKSLPTLDNDQKAALGRTANDLKRAIEQTIETKEASLSKTPIKKEFFDPTVPSSPPSLGRLHPITKIINEVEDIFSRFGFTVATGPEVEWDEINFQKLRLDKDHPSRDTQETYYFDQKKLLRVHTSSVQIRYMTDNKPPIRIISPGRVYRRDTIDETHLPSFHQIEGLMVDDKTTLTDLMGMLEHTAKSLFGQDRKVRFYGHNFPYTEPSLEVEVQNDQGKWLEILGCGVVHPEVLENCNIDSKKYQGWAFGMGADRLAMLRYNIKDIRSLYLGDLRFLNYASS